MKRTSRAVLTLLSATALLAGKSAPLQAEPPATAPPAAKVAPPAALAARPAPSLPAGFQLDRDVPYVEGGGKFQSLDISYRGNETSTADKAADKSVQAAAADARPLPLIVFIHGGGWSAGSKESFPAQWLVAKGYAVASINYRLTQEAKFPAQIEDCKAAIRFLRKNAGKYHIDPDHIGVWGDSAGGHLVALLGTTADVKELEGTEGVTGVSSRVQAVCDWYGPTDFVKFAEQSGPENTLKAEDPKSPISKLLGGPAKDNREVAAKASPITYVSATAAPTLVMHGDRDPLVPLPQSQTFVEALKKAGVEAKLDVIEGNGHGGKGFVSPERIQEIQAFFDRHLKGKEKAE